MSARSTELAQLMLDLLEPTLQAWFENNSDKEEDELLDTLRGGLPMLVHDLAGFQESLEDGSFDDECAHGYERTACAPCRKLAIELGYPS